MKWLWAPQALKDNAVTAAYRAESTAMAEKAAKDKAKYTKEQDKMNKGFGKSASSAAASAAEAASSAAASAAGAASSAAASVAEFSGKKAAAAKKLFPELYNPFSSFTMSSIVPDIDLPDFITIPVAAIKRGMNRTAARAAGIAKEMSEMAASVGKKTIEKISKFNDLAKKELLEHGGGEIRGARDCRNSLK